MTVWYKQGVVGDLQQVTAKGLGRVAHLYLTKGQHLFVTCKRDGNHMPGSLHYEGLAFDFQQNNLEIAEIKKALGRGWDVIKSNDGAIHAEYDPK